MGVVFWVGFSILCSFFRGFCFWSVDMQVISGVGVRLRSGYGRYLFPGWEVEVRRVMYGERFKGGEGRYQKVVLALGKMFVDQGDRLGGVMSDELVYLQEVMYFLIYFVRLPWDSVSVRSVRVKMVLLSELMESSVRRGRIGIYDGVPVYVEGV